MEKVGFRMAGIPPALQTVAAVTSISSARTVALVQTGNYEEKGA